MLPRLVPEEPLPPYAHVPGRTPHPVSDPAGHQYGRPPSTPAPLEPEEWPRSRPYLFGIDLFNCGYFWEAHEQWEGLWHAAGRAGKIADFLKALIKLAAAGVKHHEGIRQGVRSHARRAAELLREVGCSQETGTDLFLGFHVPQLIALAEGIDRDGWPEQAPVLSPALPSGNSPTQDGSPPTIFH